MSLKRIVIKIGSSSLADSEFGGLSRPALDRLVDSIAEVCKSGHEVVLVTSGAIASGFAALGYSVKPKAVRMKQAAAAVGQCILMHAYSESFQRHRKVVAQVLLTRAELSKKEAFDNAFNTLEELLANGAIPVINENDSVATDELRFGDNDILSSYVAGLVHADVLIIITDTDGLYERDPRKDSSAKQIKKVDFITPEIIALTSSAGSSVGTGGMRAKVIAADQALSFGVPVFIGKAPNLNSFMEILDGCGAGTYIGSGTLAAVSKKLQWIGLHGRVSGSIFIDKGASTALLKMGRSLLPAGVVNVEGVFEAGALVEVLVAGEQTAIGRGVSNYGADQLRDALGKDTRSSQKAQSPDSAQRPARLEVIHRDDWVSSRNFEETIDV